MLNHPLIHPEITRILSASGHHSRILIADGNYPVINKRGPRAEIVHLNLAPGMVRTTHVLETLLEAAPIDDVYVMDYEREGQYALENEPCIWQEYRDLVASAGSELELKLIEKWKFYEAVMTPDHVLTIQTGETSGFANLILDLGCRVVEAEE